MNLSGAPLAGLVNYYKLDPSSLLVAYDDLDLPVGVVRLRFGGGHGGHNGVRSVSQALGTEKYWRLRIGIGHPGSKDQVTDHVLKAFSRSERKQIDDALASVVDVMPDFFNGCDRSRHANAAYSQGVNVGFNCGIVGLPNVGKSTLFNCLTKAGIAAANYPFCTIEPNVGIVAVPDPRLQALADIVQPQAVLPTTIEFVDIAGLVAGAAQGEGLGNKFLANIRETHAIAHVVRCFDDADVVHVAGSVDPLRDIEVIETELALADLDTLSKAMVRVGKRARAGEKQALKEVALFEKISAHLNQTPHLRGV